MAVDLLPAVLGCFLRMDDKPRPPGCQHIFDLSGSGDCLASLFCKRNIGNRRLPDKAPDLIGKIARRGTSFAEAAGERLALDRLGNPGPAQADPDAAPWQLPVDVRNDCPIGTA